MNIIKWIRRKLGLTVEQQYSTFANEHYERFEADLQHCDCCVQVYDLKDPSLRGEIIVIRAQHVHPINVGNLVSWYKLNRSTRRKLKLHEQSA